MTTAARPAAVGRAGDGSVAPRNRPIRRAGRATPYLFLAPFLLLFLGFVLLPAVYGLWISLHRLQLPAAGQAVRGPAELHRPLQPGQPRRRQLLEVDGGDRDLHRALGALPARPPARRGAPAQPGVPRPHVLPGGLLRPLRPGRRGDRRPLPVHPRADDRHRELLPRAPAPPAAGLDDLDAVGLGHPGRHDRVVDPRVQRDHLPGRPAGHLAPTSTRPPRSTGRASGSSSATSRCPVCGRCCSSC